jgi:hypothetical protein
MTRRGHVGGNTTRPGVIATTLVAVLTVAFGPAGLTPFDTFAIAGNATVSSTAPGAAPAAPGPLLDSPAPSDSPAPTPAPTDSAAPSPSDPPAPSPSASPAPTDSAVPSPTASASPSPSDSASPSPSASASPAPSLPIGVVDAAGGSLDLGSVTLEVPHGAVREQTLFSITYPVGPDFKGIPPVVTFRIQARDVLSGAETTSFYQPLLMHVPTGTLDLDGLAPQTVTIAELKPSETWDPVPTADSGTELTATMLTTGTFGVVGESAAPSVAMTITSDAPATGRHRVDPGATVHVTLSGLAAWALAPGTVSMSIPGDWTLLDAGSGQVDATANVITWDTKDLGASFTFPIEMRAPAVANDAVEYTYTGSFSGRVVQKRSRVYAATPISILVAPKLVIQHRVMARVDPKSKSPSYGTEDANLVGAHKFEVLRVRFRVENPDSEPVGITPVIQYREPDDGSSSVPNPIGPGMGSPTPAGTQAGGSWVTLPAAEVAHDTARFYVATESADFKVESVPIGSASAGTEALVGAVGAVPFGPGLRAAAASGAFVAGVHSLGMNPASAVTIAGDGWTEIEFSVRATVWADWATAYDLRLTDDAKPFTPAVTATVTLEDNPEPGIAPGSADLAALTERGTFLDPGIVDYPLRGTDVTVAALKAAADSVPQHIHADMSLTTDTCAICHLGHTAPNAYLTNDVAQTYPSGPSVAAAGSLRAAADFAVADDAATAMCMVCHNGTGAPFDTAAQYAAAPPNDPATASYYRHDTATTGVDEQVDPHAEQFKGVVNRRSTCIDCHNPHAPTLVTDAPSVETPAGWTASGAEGLVSAVKVTNGAAGSAPQYGWLDMPPATTETVQYEYELCFKCHSGYTKLPAQDAQHPSRWALDKGQELNPANVSYHPVEAKGTNASTYIDCSLSGGCQGVAETNPYRLWSTFNSQSTVRCAQCHGSLPPGTGPTTAQGPAPSGTPDPGGDLALHASTNRGLLIQSYRDRTLKTFNDDVLQAADLKDFALCFSCHSTAPFTAVTGNRRADTAFGIHGNHMTGLATAMNPGTCLDTEIDHGAGGSPCADGKGAAIGAGSGNAICSECHFRTHSTTFKVGDQGTYSGLVNFAPDVTGVEGKPLGLDAWLKDPIDPQGGSCTLTCHGKVHVDVKY